jgi:ABC-2 type transport system ATP-binding protein
MELKPAIVAVNLTKRYKGSDEDALKSIHMMVHKGEFLGLLGPNSAGKTTFASIICGISRPSSGKVEIFDTDIAQFSRQLKRKIGLVPQEIALYESLTVRENILLYGHLLDIHGKQLQKKVKDLIRLFNLEEHQFKLISKCSGGIKRRVNLICGIIHEPGLLLLDEPTLGVDTQLREMIFEYLVELNKNGTTIIYTTHYMKEAELLCSRVNIIDHGKIIADGKPADLIAINKGCSDLGEVFLKITGRDLRD